MGEDLDLGRSFPSSGGLTDNLAEFKFISAGESCFPRGVAGRGSAGRANSLI